MSKEIITRLRKARETRIKVGRFTFIAVRPTDLDMVAVMALSGDEQIRRCLDFVTGWDGVSENDIVGGGGTTEPLPFSVDTWRAWSADRMEFWNPISEALFDAYNKHLAENADAAKN